MVASEREGRQVLSAETRKGQRVSVTRRERQRERERETGGPLKLNQRARSTLDIPEQCKQFQSNRARRAAEESAKEHNKRQEGHKRTHTSTAIRTNSVKGTRSKTLGSEDKQSKSASFRNLVNCVANTE